MMGCQRVLKYLLFAMQRFKRQNRGAISEYQEEPACEEALRNEVLMNEALGGRELQRSGQVKEGKTATASG